MSETWWSVCWQRAAADGRLSLAALDTRLEVAMRARTYSDLEPVSIDLTGGSLPVGFVPRRSGDAAAHAARLVPRRPTSAGRCRETPWRVAGAAVHPSQPPITMRQARLERATIDSSAIPKGQHRRLWAGQGSVFCALGDPSISYVLSEHTSTLAALKVTFVVAGHVLAVVAAHDRALVLLPRAHRLSGQLAMLVLMVAYTFTGLYLLFSV